MIPDRSSRYSCARLAALGRRRDHQRHGGLSERVRAQVDRRDLVDLRDRLGQDVDRLHVPAAQPALARRPLGDGVERDELDATDAYGSPIDRRTFLHDTNGRDARYEFSW